MTYLWIGGFPAFMNGKCAFAFVISLWILTGSQQIISDVTNFVIQFVDMSLNLVKMWIAIVVDNIAAKKSIENTNFAKYENFKNFVVKLRTNNGTSMTYNISVLHLHEPRHR